MILSELAFRLPNDYPQSKATVFGCGTSEGLQFLVGCLIDPNITRGTRCFHCANAIQEEIMHVTCIILNVTQMTLSFMKTSNVRIRRVQSTSVLNVCVKLLMVPRSNVKCSSTSENVVNNIYELSVIEVYDTERPSSTVGMSNSL